MLQKRIKDSGVVYAHIVNDIYITIKYANPRERFYRGSDMGNVTGGQKRTYIYSDWHIAETVNYNRYRLMCGEEQIFRLGETSKQYIKFGMDANYQVDGYSKTNWGNAQWCAKDAQITSDYMFKRDKSVTGTDTTDDYAMGDCSKYGWWTDAEMKNKNQLTLIKNRDINNPGVALYYNYGTLRTWIKELYDAFKDVGYSTITGLEDEIASLRKLME